MHLFIAYVLLCYSNEFFLFYLKLEESNRTLTEDVAKLASEKEELNNQLIETQHSKSPLELIPSRGEELFHWNDLPSHSRKMCLKKKFVKLL